MKDLPEKFYLYITALIFIFLVNHYAYNKDKQCSIKAEIMVGTCVYYFLSPPNCMFKLENGYITYASKIYYKNNKLLIKKIWNKDAYNYCLDKKRGKNER